MEQIVRQPQPDDEEAKKIVKRRNLSGEEELLSLLAGAEEVGLGNAGASMINTYASHVGSTKDLSGSKGVADATPILQLRPDLGTLPLRDGLNCTLTRKAAGELQTLSRKLRVYLNALAPAGPGGRRRSTRRLREQFREDVRGKKLEWMRPEAVPTLNQMMMGEDALMRRLLVDVLAAIPGKRATAALASRAAFDLSPDVRAAAVNALKDRPSELWRPVLLKALRYPWAPPADFAAEALVNLKDTGAIPELIALLKMPPAGRPYVAADRRTVVREAVRINHLNNCMLCHPPALRGDELVLGVDPVQTIPKQTVTNNPALIQSLQTLGRSGSGGHDYASRAATVSVSPIVSGRRGVTNTQALVRVPVPALVRADITFLRQDFSVALPTRPVARVAQPVRFDFVVRTRPVNAAERKRWEALEDKSDPQREAILFALRELTGRDEGETTKAWVKAYPLAEPEVRSKRLIEKLLRADTLERTALITRYRDGEGVEHAWALARAIPKLSGQSQELARLALVKRLARHSAAELRKHLGDRDVEICRAAVRACGEKDDLELAEDMAALLDADAMTAKLARAALKKLTGHDLADAAAWRAWLADARGE